VQIASGGYHTLAVTDSNQVFGFGKLSKGQLASNWRRGECKFAQTPTKIAFDPHLELSKVYAGSLFSIMEVAGETKQTEPA